MHTKRIIPCLDVNNGRVVKGVNFVSLRDAGDPVEIAKAYDKAGASLRVFIYRDSQDRIIATTNTPLITVGEVKKLQVTSVTSLGAFMDWGLERDVLLPFKEQTAKVEAGKSYLVRMYVDKSGRLAVSMKIGKELQPIEGYEEGDRKSVV